MPLLRAECHALLEEQEKNEDAIESVLDRIAEAEDVDDQVEREIRRYWNNRVNVAKNKGLVKRLRLLIVRGLKWGPLGQSLPGSQDSKSGLMVENCSQTAPNQGEKVE